MRPEDLILRCFAERTGDQWQAFCVDLNLAAQADTFEEAREKLEAMARDYVCDATIGEDREYAEQLLSRKAPPSIRMRHSWYKTLFRLFHWKRQLERHPIFTQALPLFSCDKDHPNAHQA